MTANDLRGRPDREERGVNGRNIVVLRNGTEGHAAIPNSTSPEKDKFDQVEETLSLPTSSDEQNESVGDIDPKIKPPVTPTSAPKLHALHRDVTFTDEVRSLDTDNTRSLKMPVHLSTEQHIAFLENQRNPTDKGILRIPGPREFDRGDMPEPVDRNGQAEDQPDKMEAISELNSNDHAMKRNITIDEPSHPRSRTGTSIFSKSHLHRPGPSNQRPSFEATSSNTNVRRRSNTFTSISSSQKREREKDVPYLSWQPTLGRNSAFVDLTEEQREELGGVEYRTLKTLALVLVC